MKMMKKVTSLFLATILIFATFAVSGVGVSAQVYSGDCSVYDGGKIVWTFDESTSTLTFSGTGKVDTPDGSIGVPQPWADYEENIKHVIIENGVDFGLIAFKDCYNISTIKIGSTVSAHYFSLNPSHYPYLSNIQVDSNNKYFTSIDGVLFEKDWIGGSDELTILCYPPKKSGNSYTLPAKTTEISNHAFYGCENLNYITISTSVTEIGGEAFVGTGYYNNSSNWENDVLYLNDILLDIDDNYQGDLTIKEGTRLIASKAFQDCLNITDVIIPKTLVYFNSQYLNPANSSLTLWEDGACYIGNYLVGVHYPIASSAYDNTFTVKDGTTHIADSVFFSCEFSSITIPNSIKVINGLLTLGDTKEINYKGTQAEWAKVNTTDLSLYDVTINCTDGVYTGISTPPQPDTAPDNTVLVIIIIVAAVLVAVTVAVIVIIVIKKKKKNKKLEESNKEYKTLS